MKQNQFTWNWYHWLLVNHSQWTTLEPLYYSSFFFATLVYGVIGNKFCWLLPQSRSTSWTRISWDTNWARINTFSFWTNELEFNYHKILSSAVTLNKFTNQTLQPYCFLHNFSQYNMLSLYAWKGYHMLQ